MQLQPHQIRHEVGLPQVPARTDADEVAVTGEVLLLTEGWPEVGSSEDVVVVPEQLHHHRQAVCRRHAHGFAARAIEVLMLGVHGDREHTVSAPLEALSAAVRAFDRGAALAGEDMNRLFIEVLLRLGRTSSRDVHGDQGGEVASASEVSDAGGCSCPVPRGRFHRQDVDAQPLRDGNGLSPGPLDVGIAKDELLFMRGLGHASCSLVCWDSYCPRPLSPASASAGCSAKAMPLTTGCTRRQPVCSARSKRSASSRSRAEASARLREPSSRVVDVTRVWRRMSSWGSSGVPSSTHITSPKALVSRPTRVPGSGSTRSSAPCTTGSSMASTPPRCHVNKPTSSTETMGT